MVKMVSLKKSQADRRAEKDALGSPATIDVPAEDQGVTVNLDHHHLTKMGVGGALKSGHKVTFHGTGTVEHSETRSEGGEDRHSARLRLSRGGVEHEGEAAEEKGEIRSEVDKAYAGAESARADRAAKRKTSEGRAGSKVAE